MFVLDGKPLALDRAFTANATLYPANWLRLSTPAERAAAGITEVPDPPTWDQRFYWGYDAEGNLIPKDHTELVELWSTQTKNTANTLLQPTDWMITREMDNGTPIDPAIKARRQQIRELTGTKLTAIEATMDTPELAAYITSPEYSQWEDPEPILDLGGDTLDFTGGVTSGYVVTSDDTITF